MRVRKIDLNGRKIVNDICDQWVTNKDKLTALAMQKKRLKYKQGKIYTHALNKKRIEAQTNDMYSIQCESERVYPI